MKSINNDIENSVFSFIPNTAETSFYGLIESVQNYIVDLLNKKIKKGQIKKNDDIDKLLSLRPRVEKIAIKDAKLRTFITEDTQREDLVGHVYDVTYGVIKPKDNLVIIDDSIVRGTTLQKSILKILDRLNPKKIIIVSSAPQIRYIDCYGIDMARLDKLIAFRAALSLHKDIGTYDKILKETYKNCKASIENATEKSSNFVKAIYEPFSSEEISKKIADLLKNNSVKSDLEIIYQSIEGLHNACPDHLGDW
jgi:Glutamine phosphoribosylpyrophosphate amidotransferase